MDMASKIRSRINPKKKSKLILNIFITFFTLLSLLLGFMIYSYYDEDEFYDEDYYTRDFYTGWDDGVNHGNQYVMANRYSKVILSPLACGINVRGENLAFEAFGTQFKYLVFEGGHFYVDTFDKYREPIYLDRPLIIFE